jgi:hypothetical protein
MICSLILALALQEAPRKPFQAKVCVEQESRREEGATLLQGLLTVRPGKALLLELGPLRTVLRDGRAIEHRRGTRSARGWDLSKVENFQLIDVWRLGREELDRIFHVSIDPDRDLPPAVSGREPVKMKLGVGARVVADGEDRRESVRRWTLVPRDPKLRARIVSIVLLVDRLSGRILCAIAKRPTEVVTVTLVDFKEIESVEESLFDLDLLNVTVEEQ